MSKEYRICLLSDADTELEAFEKPLLRMGHRVRIIPTSNRRPFEEITQDLEKFAPTFILIRNFYAFDISDPIKYDLLQWVTTKQIPVAVWYVDHPLGTGSISSQQIWARMSHPKDFAYFCIDHAHTVLMRRRGLTAKDLPLSVDEDLQNFRLRPALAKRFSDPISFCGKPPTVADGKYDIETFRKMAFRQFLKDLDQVMRPSMSFYEGAKDLSDEEVKKYLRIVEENIEILFKKNIANPLEYWRAVEAIKSQIQPQVPEAAFISFSTMRPLLDFYHSYFLLLESFQRLLPLGLMVHGGEGWSAILPTIKGLARRLADEEMLTSFAASKLSFYFTKHQFLDAVPERVFQILAVGGFPFCDQRTQMTELFEQDEIGTFQSLEEIRDKAEFYLKNESLRMQASIRGRERVLRLHTHRERMKTLIQEVETHFQL